MIPKAKVTSMSTGMGIAAIAKAIKDLRRAEVLVGIPEDTTQREGEPITNASLLFIHTHGSPLRNIPARPVLEPGVESVKDLTAPILGKACQAIMNNDPKKAEKHLNQVGLLASNAVKRKFGSAELAPNAPSTIARKGSDRPLIDEGLLRRAITYVVRVKRP